MLDYLAFFQILLSCLTIVGIAYFCAFVKIFDIQQIHTIRRVVFLVCLPAMMFREIGKRRMTWETWQPFVNAVLTEVSVHVLVLVGCMFLKDRQTRSLDTILSCTYSSAFYAFPLVRFYWGEEYIFIPVMACLVHYLLIAPLHNVLVYEAMKRDEASSGELEDSEEVEEPYEDARPIYPIDDTEHVSEVEEKDPEEKVSPEDIMEENPDVPEKEEALQSESKITLGKTILESVATPINICSILGVLWSLSGWEMPVFLEGFTSYLENGIPAAGLACIGTFLWEHPIRGLGCSWLEVSMLLAVKFVMVPVVAGFWSWILQYPNQIALICTFINVLPTSLIGYIFTMSYNHEPRSASFVFLWSNLLVLPVLLLWVVVVNVSSLFK